MELLKLAYLFALLSTTVLGAPTSNKPWFCHDLDCPRYTVIEKHDGYELRKYEASKWVGTTIASMNYSYAVQEGFFRLFDYISGQNKAKTKVPMAAPVAVKIVPGQGPACESNFTVLFFTPFAYQANTPLPTNPQLSLVDLPAINAYVASFGGYENDAELQKHATELATILNKDKKQFVSDYYFTAGYDPPFRIIGRHNEVWFLEG